MEERESDEGSTNGSFQGSSQGHSTGFLVPTIKKDSSDRVAEKNTIKKVKLKLGGGSSKVINAISASDGASDIGLCSAKSSHASLDTTSKADSSKTITYPVRKSNRISKRRGLDDDDDDEEIQFLRKVKMGKVVADVDEDEERDRKHKKLSKVMKQNVEYPLGVGKKDKTRGKAFDEEEEGLSDAEVELGNKSGRAKRREGLSELKTEITVTTRRRSGHSGNLIEFPGGLPPAPPRSKLDEQGYSCSMFEPVEVLSCCSLTSSFFLLCLTVCILTERKEDGLEVDQQLKKAEAAQRRKLQVEKAARESEVWSCFHFQLNELKTLLTSSFLHRQAEAIRKILGQDSSRKKKEDKIKKQQEDKAKV